MARDIFKNLRCAVTWTIQSSRPLTPEEKKVVKCAIVVNSQFGRCVEFFTNVGLKSIPVLAKYWPSVGQIVNLDTIKIATLTHPDVELPIYRVEF